MIGRCPYTKRSNGVIQPRTDGLHYGAHLVFLYERTAQVGPRIRFGALCLNARAANTESGALAEHERRGVDQSGRSPALGASEPQRCAPGPCEDDSLKRIPPSYALCCGGGLAPGEWCSATGWRACGRMSGTRYSDA